MNSKGKWKPDNILAFDQLCDNEPVLYGFTTYPAKTSPKYDMHYGMEMGIVRAGRMRRFYERSADDLTIGDVWFCGMWEPHGFAVLEAPCEVATFVILPQMLVNLHFTEAPNINWLTPFIIPAEQRPKADPQIKPNLLNITSRLKEGRDAESKLSKLWLRLLLLEILLEVQKIYPFRTARNTPDNTAYSCVNHALHTLFRNHRNVPTVKMAKECSMSRNHFNFLFKKMMGISFARFSLRYRLNGVALQLIHTDDPLKIIADEWGFTDASHVIRNFVKHYSISPTEYRKKNAK